MVGLFLSVGGFGGLESFMTNKRFLLRESVLVGGSQVGLAGCNWWGC